jgi:hypothetical protein
MNEFFINKTLVGNTGACSIQISIFVIFLYQPSLAIIGALVIENHINGVVTGYVFIDKVHGFLVAKILLELLGFRCSETLEVFDLPRGLPNYIYRQLNKDEKRFLGFCSIPSLNEKERISRSIPVTKLLKKQKDYYSFSKD